MNRKIQIMGLVLFAMLFTFTACSDEFLEFTPTGVVSSSDLESPETVEAMVIAAYASLGNDGLLAHQYGDLWVIMNNNVYDLSKFADLHPAGRNVLKDYAGKNYI